MGGGGEGRLWHDVWSSADGVEWRREVEHAEWSPRHLYSSLVVHGDRLWLIGGGANNYHPFRGYRDVWVTSDGRHWECACDEGPWPARIWGSATSYAGRLWFLTGFRAEPTWNNFDDVWYSADGATWQPFPSPQVWSPRHEVSPYVHAGALWVVAGNAWPLMNDVWRLRLAGLCFLSQPLIEEYAEAEYRYYARADFGPVGAPVRYRLATGPAWLALDAASGLLRGRAPASPGEHPVVLEAHAGAATATQAFSVHVIPAP